MLCDIFFYLYLILIILGWHGSIVRIFCLNVLVSTHSTQFSIYDGLKTEAEIFWQVVNCKDDLAQFYLMDCIIQVFPDEYHLQTLETLLSAFPQLQVGNLTFSSFASLL